MENRKYSSLRLSFVAATLVTASAPSWALWGDRLELFASENVTRDSNVFRLSKNRDANALLGTSDRSDTYYTTAAGFNFDVPVSLQRFQVGATVNHTRYDHFTDLNFTGHDAHALWLWEVGSLWNGQLGYTETKALASFTNFLTTTRRAFVNPLTTRRAYGNATFKVTPSWQLQAGLSETEQRNANELRRENDVDLTDADFTLNYVTAAGNKVGLGVRQQEGRYPNQQLLGGGLFDNAYTQRGVGVVVDWTPTGKSHLNARVDRLKREYDQAPQRDFEGTAFRAAYDWNATGKLTLTAIAQRDISAIEDIQTNFVLIKSFTLRPSFAYSEKLRLTAVADYSVRDYLGDPALGTAPSHTNRVRTLGATLSYQALRSLSLLLTLQRESRSSSAPLNDYTANVISINARISF